MSGLRNIDDVYKHYLKVIDENQQLKELLKEWCKLYPIVLYEHDDTLKTNDIVELYEKTISEIGEKE